MKRIDMMIKRNEEQVIPFVWINGEENEVYLNIKLAGDGASVKILGIFLGTKNSSITFNTNVVHQAKNTKSITTIRGVFKNNFSFSNNGLIKISKGAKGSDGYFTSKILLFDDAKGKSIPSLEIDENDVKAGHSSTVGRPDEKQLFYLQSRGISKDQGEKLIVSGFFEPIIKMFENDKKSQIEDKINKYLSL